MRSDPDVMTVEIIDPAKDDLADGFEFYERQSRGLGDYFLDSLFADIDSLIVYAGVHRVEFGYHRALARIFPTSSIRTSLVIRSGSLQCLIKGRIPLTVGNKPQPGDNQAAHTKR